jgi:hypothetical protein
MYSEKTMIHRYDIIMAGIVKDRVQINWKEIKAIRFQ